MPLKRCTSKGKKGYQYGSQKCYTGPSARSKAVKQMRAIKANRRR